MNTFKFDQLQEEVYYEKLDNGLDVYVLPKKGFHKTYATFTTKYGSIDRQFVPPGQSEPLQVPDGIAHFLEHKLFEKEDGDVFQKFNEQGAQANAFTAFTRTAYLFSSTTNVYRNLETLLDFVQRPYFTEKTVEKEKGIIGQEIQMYQDQPDWRLFFTLIENLYQRHPVKIDIAGTVDSISKITADLLYTCYQTFYHPSNMLLFVVGPVQASQIFHFVRENQAKKGFSPRPPVKRTKIDEPPEPDRLKKVIKMSVATPKCLIGFKDYGTPREGKEWLKHELSVHVLLEMMFGKSSEYYEQLYDEGLIDDTFSFDYTEEKEFGFSMIGGDTPEPDRLEKKLLEIIHEFKEKPLQADDVARAKKKKIGSFLRSLNASEFVANEYTRYAFLNANLFEVVPVLEQLKPQDLETVLRQHFDDARFSVAQIIPHERG